MRRIDQADLQVGMYVRRQWKSDDVVITWSGEITHLDHVAINIGRRYVDRRENIGEWYLLLETHDTQVEEWLRWFARNESYGEPRQDGMRAQAEALLTAGLTAPQTPSFPTSATVEPF